MDKYTPISCYHYDKLEELAIKNITCEIIYLNENNQKTTIHEKIKDFKTKNKQEFIILSNTQIIRLDKIIKVNQLSLKA